MGCFMNILWLLFGGILTAVEYLIASLLMMITIIGIPFGMQTLKMAALALWPFGKEVRSGERSGGLSLCADELFFGYFWVAFGSVFLIWGLGCCCALLLSVFRLACSILNWPDWH